MNRQVTARSPPLLAGKSSAIGRRKRIGEVAGGTAAECAAVWCCCPCAAMNVLVLALYKVPAGLCRRAWANRKSSKSNQNKKGPRIRKSDAGGGLLLQRGPIGPSSGGGYGLTIEELERKLDGLGVVDAGDVEAEDAMWGRFSTSGFWRSSSQREEE